MAKGDDAKRKKRNKALRKRNRKDAPVSARIASAIASKRRRKAGKRRICEGMCFSAPTLEDPFNERDNVKADSRRKRRKVAHEKTDLGPLLSVRKKLPPNCKFGRVVDEDLKEKGAMSSTARMAEEQSIMDGQNKSTRKMGVVNGGAATQGTLYRNSDGLPKFLILCLSAIQNSLALDGLEKSLFSNSWGSEFWKACSDGLDILGIGESSSGKEQIAWLASTFADIVTAREKEGVSIDSPFLLFLVPSQERAIEAIGLLKELQANQLPFPRHCVYITRIASEEHALVTSLRGEGYSLSRVSDIVMRQKGFGHINQHSDKAVAVSVVTKEEICKVDVGELETVVFVDLPTSIHEYTQVLGGMARHSVCGILHSFYSQADASFAGPLINVLEQCQQVVPESLRLLAHAHPEVGPA